jgi:hypothetical protein
MPILKWSLITVAILLLATCVGLNIMAAAPKTPSVVTTPLPTCTRL